MREIKRDLEKKRRQLSIAIQSGVESSREDPGRREIVKDPFGTASLAHDSEVSVTVAARRARELAEVTRALEEIEAGRYGVCRECGDPIARARLRVLPFATRCVACQARLEGLERAA